MPVSLIEWRVRIGRYVKRQEKEYDYNHFLAKLFNLIKRTNARSSQNTKVSHGSTKPECNAELPSKSKSSEYKALPKSGCSSNESSKSTYSASDNTIPTGKSTDLDDQEASAKLCSGCKEKEHSPDSIGSNSDEILMYPPSDEHTEQEQPCTIEDDELDDREITIRYHSPSAALSFKEEISPSVLHQLPVDEIFDNEIPLQPSKPKCMKDTNLHNGTSKLTVVVSCPTLDDNELDCRGITINPDRGSSTEELIIQEQLASQPNHINQVNDSKSNLSNMSKTSPWSSAQENTENLEPTSLLKESQTLPVSPNRRQQHSPSLREVLQSESIILPAIETGLIKDDTVEADENSDITNMLLLRSGDVELNPGPSNRPEDLTEADLFKLADYLYPEDFKKVGLALGFSMASLRRLKREYGDDILEATHQMLCDWRRKTHGDGAKDMLINKLEEVGLVEVAEIISKGENDEAIPPATTEENIAPLTEEMLQQVVEDIKRHYIIELCQIQADPLNNETLLEFGRIFTNLTLLEEDRNTTSRKPLPYSDLLNTKVNGVYPKRLLVEGEGGSGKTTLCAKIAWDWAHGNAFKQFRLVLVILLRKAKDQTIGEIVKTYLSDDNPATAKQLDNYILSHQNDVFLAMDGLDELAVDLTSLQQIVQIIHNRLFMSGTVLITSRTWRSDAIRNNIALRKAFAFIAVEGFSAENLASYITKFFHQDTASSVDLNRFIIDNDVIRENMAPFPIYTAMLCIMWKEYDGERRMAMCKLQTFSQLFDEMINFLVDHYLSKHMDSSADATTDESRLQILDHLTRIGEIAFQSLLQRKMVIPEEEFQTLSKSMEIGCKVGVLTREKRTPPRRGRKTNPLRTVSTVQFPHKLFQEYVSGMYLALLYSSNRSEYDSLAAKIVRSAREYGSLLYFTAAQHRTVGMDIVLRLINIEDSAKENFLVDVAYESQDQTVAKAVTDYLLRGTNRRLLWISRNMEAHTVSGHLFVMDHRKVEDLSIEKSCGRTVSQDLAEFMCTSQLLRSVNIDTTMHDAFYLALGNVTAYSKIETLVIKQKDLSSRSLASCGLAQFICKMSCLKKLTLGTQDKFSVHDDFYATVASMASSTKIETLVIRNEDLSSRPSASRSLAQFICKLSCLKNLTLGSQDQSSLHDDFYSTLSSMASSTKIETLVIDPGSLSARPHASRDLAQFICKMSCLRNLTLGNKDKYSLHDEFYMTFSSMASSTKTETLVIDLEDLSTRPLASRDLAEFICMMSCLKNLILGTEGIYSLHDDFYSTLSSRASSAKIETLTIRHEDLSSRSLASRDLAAFICKMSCLKNLTLKNKAGEMDKYSLHDGFYSALSSILSSTAIETLIMDIEDLSPRPLASRDLAKFICKISCLKNLTLGSQDDCSIHDDFYSTLSSMASSARIETLSIRLKSLTSRQLASREVAQFICQMSQLKKLTLDFRQNHSLHDDFFSTISSLESNAEIETLLIDPGDLSARPLASRNLAQFICKMSSLKNLTLKVWFSMLKLHDQFYSTLSSMTSSAKLDRLCIGCVRLHEGQVASRDLAHFVCRIPYLKNLVLSSLDELHDDFYSTTSLLASTSTIETIDIVFGDLSRRPQASRDLAQFISKTPHLKKLTIGCDHKVPLHDDFYTTSSAMALSAKVDDQDGNTCTRLTELTISDKALITWRQRGPMFDSVKNVTINVFDEADLLFSDVIQRIRIQGATELTIETKLTKPSRFMDESIALPSAVVTAFPQLMKVTFSKLRIENDQIEPILKAFRSTRSQLKTIRFIRCYTDEGVDDFIQAFNGEQTMKVEIEHGEPM